LLRREEAYGTGLCKSFEQPHQCNTARPYWRYEFDTQLHLVTTPQRASVYTPEV
jgi:hypothetical protein